MNPKIILLVYCSYFLTVRAEDSLDWSKISGGGGTSTGGPMIGSNQLYSVTGTIGQPDAGAMNGGNYSLTGGFWSWVAAVQTPGSPLLRITLTPQLSTIILSWPASATGFVLQENASLTTTNWTAVATEPVVVGEEQRVTISPPAGKSFYRLKQQ
jgi:hypothetical protein